MSSFLFPSSFQLVFRVNTIKSSTEAVIKEINEHLDKTDSRQRCKVNPHHTVNDAVLITPEVNSLCDSLKTATVGYVVVGEMCGLAVLRGAHVFVPGNQTFAIRMLIHTELVMGTVIFVQLFRII